MSNKKPAIAIYGLSPATQELLEQIGDQYDVVGLLDGYRQEGTLYGRKIISLNEAVQKKIEAIIVAARPSSRRIIVNRIREICGKNKIALYDENGNDLLAAPSERVAASVRSGITREELCAKIDQSDVISFDIFDTLVTRTVMYPSDVFALVEQKMLKKYGRSFEFYMERQAAEHLLSQRGVPTIGDIYNELENRVDLSKEELREIQTWEWETDQQVIVPRDDMCEMLRYALKQRKRVYLVSDMYYSAAQLVEILSELGIVGYEKLLVSCEYGTTKEQELFQILKAEAKADRYLHIGDHYRADVKSAERNGIAGVWVKSGLELFEEMYWSETFAPFTGLAERVKLGMFISRMFNSPFVSKKGSAVIKSPQDLGYMIFAPVLSDFTLWLYRELKGKDTTVLFAARDGWLMKELFDRLLNCFPDEAVSIQTVYFLTSRISAVGAGLFREQDVLQVAAKGFNGTLGELLKARFALSEEEIEPEDWGAPIGKKAILKYVDCILKHSEENRKRYLKYIGGLKLDERELVFFDFVSSGTCQAGLEKIMRRKMRGCYFIRIMDEENEKKRLQVSPFFGPKEDGRTGGIFEDFFVLETILTSPDPSLKGFDAAGAPEYLPESRSPEEIVFIRQVHEGIVQYFEQYIGIVQPVDNCVSQKCSEELLELLHKVPIENEIFQRMVYEDSFYARKVRMKELM